MILKYPKKGESIYDLNLVLRNHKDFVAIGEIKMQIGRASCRERV